jgi:ankyrin repeat protein
MNTHTAGAGRLDPTLDQLIHAIAARDGETALRLLAAAPQLATERALVGATRASATSHFFESIHRYVYAGDTALHIAAAAYRADVAEALVARGADVAAPNRRGAQPIHSASDGGPGRDTWNPPAQAATIEFLLGAGADANAANDSGVAPLHIAVRARCAGAAAVLLAHGANPRGRNGNGSTPLHLAVLNTGRGGTGTDDAREQQAEIIRLLLAHGARPGDTDAHGTTVAEHATTPWIAALLRA